VTRKYEQRQRASTAAATRQRIVDATVALHAEHGIAVTSFREVAERADVGIGTVYHHFPTLDDLVSACGSHLWQVTAPPTLDVFAGLRSRRARLECLVTEVFGWYERYPSWRRGLADADRLDVLARGVARREAHLRSLVEAALGPGAEPRTVDMVRAVVDFEVYRSLVASGRTTAEAAAAIAALVDRGT